MDRDTARIINASIEADARIRGRVTAYIERAWGSLTAWRDADIARFIDLVTPVVLSGQRQIAQLTNTYLAQYASQVLGGRMRAGRVDLDAVTGSAVRAADPRDVYHRAGVTTWTELSRGRTLTDAVKAGRIRAVTMALTDLQLAKTHTARLRLAGDSRVTGYRRVLSGRENCGICLVASRNRYRKAELQPIHGRCDCGVQPIYSGRDPGAVPTRTDTAALTERFGGTDPGAGEITVHEHGEIGPVLAVAGQHWTGPADI